MQHLHDLIQLSVERYTNNSHDKLSNQQENEEMYSTLLT